MYFFQDTWMQWSYHDYWIWMSSFYTSIHSILNPTPCTTWIHRVCQVWDYCKYKLHLGSILELLQSTRLIQISAITFCFTAVLLIFVSALLSFLRISHWFFRYENDHYTFSTAQNGQISLTVGQMQEFAVRWIFAQVEWNTFGFYSHLTVPQLPPI